MSFLTDQNLTFHRFSDGTISFDGMKTRKVTQHQQPNEEQQYDDSSEVKRKISNMSDYQPNGQQQPVWTTVQTIHAHCWWMKVQHQLPKYCPMLKVVLSLQCQVNIIIQQPATTAQRAHIHNTMVLP
ncbi:unnamed protein product [Diamesa tonsa]